MRVCVCVCVCVCVRERERGGGRETDRQTGRQAELRMTERGWMYVHAKWKHVEGGRAR